MVAGTSRRTQREPWGVSFDVWLMALALVVAALVSAVVHLLG